MTTTAWVFVFLLGVNIICNYCRVGKTYVKTTRLSDATLMAVVDIALIALICTGGLK